VPRCPARAAVDLPVFAVVVFPDAVFLRFALAVFCVAPFVPPAPVFAAALDLPGAPPVTFFAVAGPAAVAFAFAAAVVDAFSAAVDAGFGLAEAASPLAVTA
jgi:hypothetical protein